MGTTTRRHIIRRNRITTNSRGRHPGRTRRRVSIRGTNGTTRTPTRPIIRYASRKRLIRRPRRHSRRTSRRPRRHRHRGRRRRQSRQNRRQDRRLLSSNVHRRGNIIVRSNESKTLTNVRSKYPGHLKRGTHMPLNGTVRASNSPNNSVNDSLIPRTSNRRTLRRLPNYPT